MSLNFFELGKSLFYILLQFHMYGVGDRRQLLADVGANPFDALPGLHRQRCDLQLERARLFLAAGRQMLLEGGVELQEALGQTIGGCETEVALRLLEAAGEVGARLGQFFVEAARNRIEPLVESHKRITCGKRPQLADYDRNPS